ncbi:unnamed protein product [Caenorhabditis nigoni]
MAEWCASNLRNCDGWKSAGLELTTNSDENAKLLDSCIRQLVSLTDCDSMGGFENSCKKLAESDPEAILSRAFLLAVEVMAGKEAASNPELAQKLKKLEDDAEKYGNDREKRHAKAAILWGRGKHHEASGVWDRLLDDYPTDLMAVRFAQDAHFFNGTLRTNLATLDKILPFWTPDMPCYSFLFGIHAFALEESGKYVEAEKAGREALRLNRFDCWASHALAHVMEMGGRHKEGRDFMYKTEDDWKRGWMLSTHNYWHTAVFHIEHAEYESALDIFDKEVGHRFNRTNMLLDMHDASSLLWRLELEGVNVGKDRWEKIKRLGEYVDTHSTVFTDVHIGLALCRQQDWKTEKKLRDSLEMYSGLLSEDNAEISKTIGVPLYDGMLDFARGNYDDAVQKMYPLRSDVIKIGGSHAQRDVFAQTLIQACILTWNDSQVLPSKKIETYMVRKSVKKEPHFPNGANPIVGMDVVQTINFQYNRDSLFSRNVPPSLPKFVGRPEVVLFWDAEKPNQKSYIDVKFLVAKASEIFKQHFENVYVRDSTLKRLSMGLKESEKKNLHGFESLRMINQTVVSDTWQYYFLTVARWLMHFEEFQKIDDTVKLKILETIWHIWATLDRHCATASYRRSHPNAPKTQIISRRGIVLDLTKVQFDSTWLSDYPPSEIAYFLRQSSSDHFDIIGALLELEPSDMEMTFMLAQLSFEYAGKRCQGEILKLTEHFQKLLANDLHNYYVKEMNMPKYSNRLSKMMKINNSIQKNLC